MSLIKQVMTEANVAAAAHKESTIAEAAKLLTESGLAKRCPSVAKMMESTSKADKYQAAVLTKVLNNTAALYESAGVRGLLKEDATSSSASLMPGVASLTPRVVDVVSIFYPNMVAHHIADIQALDRQSGEIFIIKTTYGNAYSFSANADENIAEGDIVFEKPTDGGYASEWLVATLDSAVVPATPYTVNGTVTLGSNQELRKGSLRVMVAGKQIAADYGTGVIVGKGVAAGSTIDYANGTIKIVFDAELEGKAVEVSIAYDSETKDGDDFIRTVDFNILEQPVRAEEHPLRSTYSVAASLVANAHLNLDLDEMITTQLSGTIQWERDLALIKKVSKAAADKPELAFDCATNGENLTEQMRYSSYGTIVSTARGLIQEQAGRGTVDFMIVSAKEGLTVVENMEGFVAAPEAKRPVGPYLAGTLRDGTISVIAVPYTAALDPQEVIFGFKGFQKGDASVVVAEWVPLYLTPTFQAPNLRNHKGALSFYDMFVNNDKYLAKGKIMNFNK